MIHTFPKFRLRHSRSIKLIRPANTRSHIHRSVHQIPLVRMEMARERSSHIILRKDRLPLSLFRRIQTPVTVSLTIRRIERMMEVHRLHRSRIGCRKISTQPGRLIHKLLTAPGIRIQEHHMQRSRIRRVPHRNTEQLRINIRIRLMVPADRKQNRIRIHIAAHRQNILPLSNHITTAGKITSVHNKQRLFCSNRIRHIHTAFIRIIRIRRSRITDNHIRKRIRTKRRKRERIRPVSVHQNPVLILRRSGKTGQRHNMRRIPRRRNIHPVTAGCRPERHLTRCRIS